MGLERIEGRCCFILWEQTTTAIVRCDLPAPLHYEDDRYYCAEHYDKVMEAREYIERMLGDQNSGLSAYSMRGQD